MHNNQSKQDILQRIAAAGNSRLAFVNTPIESSEDIYKPIAPNPIDCFKNELESISGQCFVCKNKEDLFTKLTNFIKEKNIPIIFCKDLEIATQLDAHSIANTSEEYDFENMLAGITTCDFLIARTGSIIVNSATASGRQINVFPPIHIVLANTSQILSYPEDAYKAMLQKYNTNMPSTICTVTGPSRTADIEKTLVLGAHGPKELVVFLSKE